MDAASTAATTASIGTSHNSEIFSLRFRLSGRSERHTMTSGCRPRDRSSFTECWVGFVFSSPVGPMNGTSETWTNAQWSRPTSLRSWRIASRNGSDSMSPTVPPTSTITTSASSASASERMRCLISFVMWGMTWTVLPRNSPRRSFAMTDWYTEPVVTLEPRWRFSSVNRS